MPTDLTQSHAEITAHAYGKDLVKVLKVTRHPGGRQDVADYTVRALLTGEFGPSYTHADNTMVVATDSTKNIINVLAKQSKVIDVPELFAAEIADFFLRKYAHVHKIQVDISTRRWERMVFDGKQHDHSFLRAGKEERFTHIEAVKTQPAYPSSTITYKVTSGFTGLEVLKTTNSAFVDFYRDEYATLPDMADRLLSTRINAKWNYAVSTRAELERVNYDAAYNGVVSCSLNTFAQDMRPPVHASVQTTIYVMACDVLKLVQPISDISYALPNIHYFPVDLGPFGIKNLGSDASLYKPMADPSGYITATISRKGLPRL